MVVYNHIIELSYFRFRALFTILCECFGRVRVKDCKLGSYFESIVLNRIFDHEFSEDLELWKKFDIFKLSLNDGPGA